MTTPLAVPKHARRIAALSLAAAVAGALRLGPSALVVFLVAVAYVAAFVVVTALPRHRRLVEAGAAGLVIPAALPVGLGLYAALAVMSAAGAHVLLYGRWARASRLRLTATATQVARAPLPADAVWPRLVPGSSHPDDFWTGTLVDHAPDPDDPMTLYARFASESGLFTEATFTFLTAEPPREAHYLAEFDGLPEDEEMSLYLRLTEEDGFSTLIESEAVRANMTLARAVLLWFDDTMGDDWGDLCGPGVRNRRWRMEWPEPAPEAPVEAVGEALEPKRVPLHVVAAPAEPAPPRPQILHARLKDLPDPDDFEEPFDIMRLMEKVRA